MSNHAKYTGNHPVTVMDSETGEHQNREYRHQA